MKKEIAKAHGLTRAQIREIRIADLEEAFDNIEKTSDENIWYQELTAIQNALNFMKGGY
jgi:Ca2+-binding EF-hand superfamily protein